MKVKGSRVRRRGGGGSKRESVEKEARRRRWSRDDGDRKMRRMRRSALLCSPSERRESTHVHSSPPSFLIPSSSSPSSDVLECTWVSVCVCAFLCDTPAHCRLSSQLLCSGPFFSTREYSFLRNMSTIWPVVDFINTFMYLLQDYHFKRPVNHFSKAENSWHLSGWASGGWACVSVAIPKRLKTPFLGLSRQLLEVTKLPGWEVREVWVELPSVSQTRRSDVLVLLHQDLEILLVLWLDLVCVALLKE